MIADRLRDRVGEVDVRLEQSREIPRNRNGKFQAVVCDIR
jgi:hypothetical protein